MFQHPPKNYTHMMLQNQPTTRKAVRNWSRAVPTPTKKPWKAMINLALWIRPACKRSDVFLLLHKNSYLLTLFWHTRAKILFHQQTLVNAVSTGFLVWKAKRLSRAHFHSFENCSCHIRMTNCLWCYFYSLITNLPSPTVGLKPHLSFGNSLSCSSYSISYQFCC